MSIIEGSNCVKRSCPPVILALIASTIACNLQIGITPTPTPSLTPTTGLTYIPTATVTPTPTITPTNTPVTPTQTPLPTATPTSSYTPSPPKPIQANICKGCKVNFRVTPGTAGRIIKMLDETVIISIIGRTDDGTWLQVTLTDGRVGWLSAQFVVLDGIDISPMPVAAQAIDASATPTYVNGAPRVVSNITATSRNIFLKGQQLGNQISVFTRVGDSISASPLFLVPFGTGQYDLADYTNQLSGAVSFFAGSFTRPSNAAGNGWGADRILQPGFSNPGLCGNDSPLVCEYKNAKPSVALILIGTNDAGGVDPGVYAANLRQIVQISIDMGVIPVLTTLPPKHMDAWNNARIDEWNGIIRTMARQYDIPLLDYSYAMQKLPNQGVGPDGVHPSEPPGGASGIFNASNLNYGYTMRNLTALQMLDQLWHQVLY
jgi:hypothetical protein